MTPTPSNAGPSQDRRAQYPAGERREKRPLTSF